jgi:trk system potassium uptake protein TrkA
MRVVIIGASGAAVETVTLLLKYDYEVVVIETDQHRIDELSEILECGFLHGDGSKPSILREANAENTDVLLCLSDSDQDNIISALVGRELGYSRIILKISDSDYKTICAELKLDEVILPDTEISLALSRLIQNEQAAGHKAEVQGDLRFFTISIGEDDAGPLSDLNIPDEVRVVAVTRSNESVFPDDDMTLQAEDSVLLLASQAAVDDLCERFKEASDGTSNLGV